MTIRQKPTGAHHHGDLRAALLESARLIAAERGAEAVTLRECARRAGVSHGAPAHHFGTLTGLLTEVAADGFERLVGEMDRLRAKHHADARAQLKAVGLGYVNFARSHPGHFRIMFRGDLTDATSDRLRRARNAARGRLDDALAAASASTSGLAARASLAWCCVHGYASLWVEGPMREPGEPDATTLLALLEPALLPWT